ncbi:exodeoxyribonuclease VII small subunit [Sphingobacterium sp. Mn56C]|uniref:exodeoxyribonuclease VII small subunit n=1 Tax=Sphingobacterium sp. Mn56C TaxID=3395261 RepID=UPI003BC96DDF
MENKYTYIEAFQELKQIVAAIESGHSNVDDLAAQIKRAAELIQVCKAKLTASEKEVEQLIMQLQASSQTEST